MLKKLILAATGLALRPPRLSPATMGTTATVTSAASWSIERYVVQRPVVVREYYRPAPRPVYVVRQAPPPVVLPVHSMPVRRWWSARSSVPRVLVHSVMTGY